MLRLNRSTWIETSELFAWAYDSDAAPPTNADGNVWDLVLLEWCADDRVYVDLAGREDCPKRETFVFLLKERVRRRYQKAQVETTKQPSARKTKKLVEASRTAHADGLAKAQDHANALALLVGESRHPDLAVLAENLKRLIADASTLKSAYWLPPLKGF
jgi:hypothetical protein